MLYGQRSDGVFVTYDGMTEGDIGAMLTSQGLSCVFIDKATYDAAIAPK